MRKRTKSKVTPSHASGDRFFNEPKPSTGEVTFLRKVTDARYYKLLDKQLQPIPPPKREPYMTLAEITGDAKVTAIAQAGRTVFHSVGDTGPTSGPKTIAQVADRMVADFADPEADVPAFFFHLGDVVYNFGETEYYFDQFYEAYRDYPGPIFAIPGNHDGMVYQTEKVTSLAAFLANFCDERGPRHPAEAGGLVRTTMTQPGVYFSLEAPLITLIGLYSNVGEHAGVISSENGKYTSVDDSQLGFLIQALQRADAKKKKEKGGAIILATHHPPYSGDARHAGSEGLLKDIDACCKKAGVVPDALFSGHAHFYQRFTSTLNGKELPFLVAGSGGHRVTPPQQQSGGAIRTPLVDPNGVTMEKYLPVFGYLRVVVTAETLMIEFYDCSENEIGSKSPADRCSVDLKSHSIVHQLIPAKHQWKNQGRKVRRKA